MGTHYQGTVEEILALEVFIKLTRAADTLSTRANQHLSEIPLTISQFGVLEALYHLGPLHQNQLAAKILRSSGNLTLVIDNLEKRGLVVRQPDPDDRRCTTILLTSIGNDLVMSLLPRHVAGITEAVSYLTPEEQTELARLCRKLGLSLVEAQAN